MVDLGEHKDASGLYLSDREGFEENLNRALAAAVPLAELERREAAEKAREAWAECAELAHEPNILDRFARDLGTFWSRRRVEGGEAPLPGSYEPIPSSGR